MKISESSVLYAIPWAGAGTLFSESICSYFYRLAYLHRVTPATLYRAYIVPRLRELGMGTHVCYQIQDGLGLSADSVVLRCLTDALVELTGVETIRHGSLQGLAALVGHRGLAHLKRRYCPKCFAEPHLDRYGHALWEFQAVKACPIHGVRLQAEVCGDASVRLAPNQRPQLYGVCRQCGSIGMVCGVQPHVLADSNETWAAREVGDVVAYVSGGSDQLSRESLEAGIAACVGHYRSRTELARRLHCTPSALIGGATGRPSFSVLLAMAAHCECSLLSIFRGKPIPTSNGPQRFTLPTRVEAPWRFDTQLERNIELLAERYRFLDTCPDSGAKVSQRLGVKRLFLKRRAPELWNQIVSAHQRYVAEQLGQTLELKKARLLTAIEKIVASSRPLTVRSIFSEAGVVGWQHLTMLKVLNNTFCLLPKA